MQKYSRKVGLVMVALALVVVSGSTVLALPDSANVHAQAATTNPSTHQPVDPGSQGKGHGQLAAGKLRACQNRQRAITNIMSRIADRGQKQLDLFGTIATRVEAFYAKKAKTLSNYSTLVADVNAKQAAAQTTVANIKSASTGFNCEGSDPKGFVDTFRTSLKSEISALQDYRTSVKNLTVGVKSVQGTTTSTANQSDNGGNQ